MTKPGYRFKCKAASFSLGQQHKFMRGQVFELPADDPLVPALKAAPAFEVTAMELPADEPVAATAQGAGDEPAETADTEPTGEPVDLDDVHDLPDADLERLQAAGFNTTAEVLAAGADKLTEIDGIGPRTAGKLVALCLAAQGA